MSQDSSDASLRSFRFHYGVTIRGLSSGDQVRGWIPEPAENQYQSVESAERELPGNHGQHREQRYGNRMSFFSVDAKSPDDLKASMSWDIVRRGASPLDPFVDRQTIPDSAKQQFLSANRMVPVNGKTLKALNVTVVPSDPIDRGRYLFDVVAKHMKYDKSRPGYGNGNALWACESRFGNCTDYHSLFISLARGSLLPARFEIGFSIPKEPGEHPIGGYHCWAYFLADDRWIPVDISDGDKHPEQLNDYFGKLSADRVAFTTGRDLILQPPQEAEPLNFFVYPHVEVNGEVWPRDRVVTRFTSESK